MEEERDIVVFTDDEGNDLELEVLDYIFYNGEEYAVLSDVEDEDECGCEECAHEHEHAEGEECDCCEEQSLYIMKVVQMDDDMEEFVPVEDDAVMEQLINIVQQRFEEDMDDEDDTDEEETDGEDK